MAITDEDSAKAWLDQQTHEVQIAFEARFAMRLAPGLGFADSKTLGKLALPVLRATLISGVAAAYPSPDIKKDVTRAALSAALSARTVTRSSATSASFSGRFSSNTGAYTASLSAYSAANSASSSTYSAALSANVLALSSNPPALSVVDWDTGHFDGNRIELVFKKPLWPPEIRGRIPAGEPVGLTQGYTKLAAYFDSDPQVWRFWKRWLDGMRAGQPMDWKLQEQIALIEDEIWKAGPEAVAERIDEIEKRFALKKALREAETELVLDAAQRLGIGGNNPPERIDDIPVIPEIQTIIWAPIETLKEEVEEPQPNRQRIKNAIEDLKEVLASCRSYLGKSLNTTAQAGFVVIGGRLGSDIYIWLSGHGPLISRVIGAAQDWFLALL